MKSGLSLLLLVLNSAYGAVWKRGAWMGIRISNFLMQVVTPETPPFGLVGNLPQTEQGQFCQIFGGLWDGVKA